MRYCPKCNNSYNDDSLSFCLECGTPLTVGSFSSQAKTQVMNQPVTANVQSKPTDAGQNIYTQTPSAPPYYQSGSAAIKPSRAGLLLAIISIFFTLGGILLFVFGLVLAGLNTDNTIVGLVVLIAMFIPALGTLFGLIALYRAFRSHDGKGAKGFAVIAIVLNLLYVIGFIALMLLGAVSNYMNGNF
jgi:hypothetical protein